MAFQILCMSMFYTMCMFYKMCMFYTLNIAEIFLVSQSSDKLTFQVMAIARNKRPAERFLVLLRCGLLQRRRFFY